MESTGVIQKLDSQGALLIQFPGHLLNCLPVDLPYLRKLPTPSVWMIRSLAPSILDTATQTRHPRLSKYRDSTTSTVTAHSQEFDIAHLKSTLAEPPLTPWASITRPDTEDFAPATLCLSGFTPAPHHNDDTSPTNNTNIYDLTTSLLNGLSTRDKYPGRATQTPTTHATPPHTARTSPSNAHHQGDHPRTPAAQSGPPPTTVLEQAGRACHNTSAQHNSCVLHSVIAEVHRIHHLQHRQPLRQTIGTPPI